MTGHTLCAIHITAPSCCAGVQFDTLPHCCPQLALLACWEWPINGHATNDLTLATAIVLMHAIRTCFIFLETAFILYCCICICSDCCLDFSCFCTVLVSCRDHLARTCRSNTPLNSMRPYLLSPHFFVPCGPDARLQSSLLHTTMQYLWR